MTRRLVHRLFSGLVLSALAWGLVACSSDKPKPAPLEPLAAPRLAVKTAWQRSVGKLPANTFIAAVPDAFVVADRDGSIVTFDAASGAERSRAKVSGRVAAGVGSDGRFSAVVTRDNELVVVEGTAERWRKRLGASVVTPPLVAGERVFVQGTDRTVQAFDALDGRQLWSYARAGDPLALAQPGVLAPFRDTLLAGIGPRLVALEPLLGTVRGEVALAMPRGTNEVERLADLVGPPARVADMVCARAFQSAVTCVNADRGGLAWTRNFGGYQGIAADADYVFAADGSDRLAAWRRLSGDSVWSSERLRWRGLSAPLALPGAVVYGDSQGYVHFLSRDKGELLQRLETDRSGVAAPPVRTGSTMLIVTRDGGVFAFRVE